MDIGMAVIGLIALTIICITVITVVSTIVNRKRETDIFGREK
jgi:hypothetical protein